MSWLDANEVFLMEVVSRDRVEDLRLAIDLVKQSDDGADELPHDIREGGHWFCRRLSAARA